MTTNTEALRQQFEEWAEGEDFDLSIRFTKPVQYTDGATKIAWDAFQACAALASAPAQPVPGDADLKRWIDEKARTTMLSREELTHAVEKLNPAAPQPVAMTTQEAVEHARSFARNCSIVEHAKYKYLQGVDAKWMPHEWVVRAIVAASARATQAAPKVPEHLDVRRIMLDVVPGADGMGHEVFATCVEDVVAVLTDLGQRLEDAIGAPSPEAKAQAVPDQDEAIRIWHKHCDAFASKLGDHPPSCVINAMVDFAALAPSPEAKAQAVPEGAPEISATIEGDAGRTLLGYLEPDLDTGEFTPVRLMIGRGHEGYGLYVCDDEYPEDGSSFLAAMLTAAPQPPAPSEQDPDEVICPIDECYGDCPRDQVTCPNPCSFEGRYAPKAIAPSEQRKQLSDVCPNCDTAMPEGCGGVFKRDGAQCWLNRGIRSTGGEHE